MSPDVATISQPSTVPLAPIASDITCCPSNVSPTGSCGSLCAPGVNRRSNVTRVNSALDPLLPSLDGALELAEVTSQLSALLGFRLDSKRHECASPSPLMVTVTRSHQGAVESRVDDDVVVAAAAIDAADARARPAIA